MRRLHSRESRGPARRRFLAHGLGVAVADCVIGTAAVVAAQSPAIAASNTSPDDSTPCTPVAQGDYVHVSSGDASGHGWWQPGTCTAGTDVVGVTLEEYLGDAWEQEAWATGTVKPGGGSGNRVTARKTCSSATMTYWRSVVVVSVGGEESGQAQTTTDQQDIACRA